MASGELVHHQFTSARRGENQGMTGVGQEGHGGPFQGNRSQRRAPAHQRRGGHGTEAGNEADQ